MTAAERYVDADEREVVLDGDYDRFSVDQASDLGRDYYYLDEDAA